MMNDGMMPTTTVANSRLGVTNIIDKDVISTDLAGVFDRIFTILAEHYGPYGKYAMIVDASDEMLEPQHTKDGINILRKIEFYSPMENVIKQAVARIGSAVEGDAGDGTTSAMMLMCAALKELIDLFHNDPNFTTYTYEELRDAFSMFRRDVAFSEEKMKLTVENLAELYHGDTEMAVYNLVYWQCYSSSHGDTEIAKAVAEMFMKTPKDCWQYLLYRRSKYETDVRVKVEESKGQFEIDARCPFKDCFNIANGTGFEGMPGECRVFMMADTLCSTRLPYQEELWNLIRDDEYPGPIVIIAHEGIDSNTFGELSDIVRRHPDKIAYFGTRFDDPKMNDIVVMAGAAELHRPDKIGNNVIEIPGAHVTFVADRLYIDNVFQVDENHINVNLKNPTSWASQLMAYIDQRIDFLQRGDKTATTESEIENLRRLYSCGVAGKQQVLTIGGMAYDNITAKDIVEDCLSAARTVLRHGAVIGGNKVLYAACKHLSEVPFDEYATRIDRMESMFAEAFARALRKIYSVSLNLVPEAIADAKREQKQYPQFNSADEFGKYAVDVMNPGRAFLLTDLKERLLSNYENGKKGDVLPLIIQPSKVDLTILDRFAESALKYVMTARIVTKHAAYVNTDKE